MTTQDDPIESLFAHGNPEQREQLRTVWHELKALSDSDPTALEEFRSVIHMLLLGELPEVPSALQQAALAKLRPLLLPAAPNGVRDGTIGSAILRAGQRIADEIRAVLILDSHAGAALPGIRSATRLQPRQLLYESPLGSMHLQIEGDDRSGRVEVMGQFIPSDDQPQLPRGRAVLLIEDQALLAPLEETGEFRFAPVPAGTLELRLELGDHALSIAPLRVTG